MTPRETKIAKVFAQASDVKFGSLKWKKIFNKLTKDELVEVLLVAIQAGLELKSSRKSNFPPISLN